MIKTVSISNLRVELIEKKINDRIENGFNVDDLDIVYIEIMVGKYLERLVDRLI